MNDGIMSTNVLPNVGFIFNVCEKSLKYTKVTGTKTGAVPSSGRNAMIAMGERSGETSRNRPNDNNARHFPQRTSFGVRRAEGPPALWSPLRHIVFTLPIVRQPSRKTFPNMSGVGGATDPHTKATLGMLKVRHTPVAVAANVDPPLTPQPQPPWQF
jgi:hypothetical protein